MNNVGLQTLRSSDLLCVCLLLLRECRHQVFYRAWLIHLPLVVGTKKNKRKQMDKQKKKKQSQAGRKLLRLIVVVLRFLPPALPLPVPSWCDRLWIIIWSSWPKRPAVLCVFRQSTLSLYCKLCVCVCKRDRERKKKCVCIYTCMCVWVCVCAGERGRPIVPSFPLCCCRYRLFTSV